MTRARALVVGPVAALLAACSTVGTGVDSGSTGDGAISAPPADGSPDARPSPDDASAPPPPDASAAVDATLSDASDASPPSDGGPSFDSSAAHARADDAVEAMLLAFWDPAKAYLNSTVGAPGLTGYWTFIQAWDAVLDAVERHGDQRFSGTLAIFHDLQNAQGWSRDYYDDENWAALALLRAYDLTGNASYLSEAETLYADIMGAWDTTCCGVTPGGLWWDRPHTQKATAANAGAVVTGARLYEHTKNAAYLSFAQKAFTFWSANMVDPTTHQVVDNISAEGGVKRRWKFTYNEGLMIGAAVALAHASGDPSPLTLAHEVAGFMLAHETNSSSVGSVLSDGTNGSCGGDCAQFKGIGARYLATLYVADPSHSEYLDLLQRSAEGAWTLARDPASRVYGVDWGAPFSPPAHVEAASSAAMTLAAVARLEGHAPPDAPGVYEAEEGVLHQVGLEAKYGAFRGWGYVAGWSGDGQWVDFPVTVPAAAAYDLTFRYAAGGGNATRLVSVNGVNVAANQSLPSTSSWSTYATVALTLSLPAGASTVSLIYNSSLGSSGYLNLDQLTVTKH